MSRRDRGLPKGDKKSLPYLGLKDKYNYAMVGKVKLLLIYAIA
jgi:hypothetical protein